MWWTGEETIINIINWPFVWTSTIFQFYNRTQIRKLKNCTSPNKRAINNANNS
jgi:hypothetical protein